MSISPDFDPLFDFTPIPMWIYDLDSLKLLRVNPSAIDKYGYSEDELLSMSVSNLYPLEDYGDYFRSQNTAIKNSHNGNGETSTHISKCGKLFNVKLNRRMFEYNGRKAVLEIVYDNVPDEHAEGAPGKNGYLTSLAAISERLNHSNDHFRNIEQAFEIVGETLEVDRVYYFKSSKNKFGELLGSQRIEWNKGSVSAQIDNPDLQDLPFHELQHFTEPLLEGKPFKAIISQLPESSNTRHLLQSQDIKSILAIPVVVKHELKGFIGADDCQREKEWSIDEIEFLKTVTQNVSGILEKKEILDELMMKERKFRSLVQDGADLFAILDAEGNYTYSSPSCEKLLGYDEDYFIGRNSFDFIHPDDQQMIRDHLEGFQNERSMELPPYRFRDARGNWRWIQTILTNLIDDPAVKGIVANKRDITVQKNQTESLKLANERYRLASRASQDHMYDWNLETGDVTRTGESLYKLFGYEIGGDNELDSDFWKRHVHQEDLSRIYNELHQALKDPERKDCIQRYRFKKADGKFATIIDSGHILRDEHGKAKRLIGVVKDISSLVIQESEEKLLLNLSSAIGKPGSLEERLDEAVKCLLEFSGMATSEIWIRSLDGKNLHLIGHASATDEYERFYSHKDSTETFEFGEGLPGRVAMRRKSLIWDNLKFENKFIRSSAAAASNLNCALGIPIVYRDELLGVFVLLSNGSYENLKYLQELLEGIGEKIGSVLKEKINEEELNQYLDISPNLLSIIGFDGNFKKVNDACANLLGYSKEELISQPIYSLVHTDDVERAVNELGFIDSSNSKREFQARFITKDGHIKWILWTIRHRPEDQLIFAVGNDITELKEADLRLSAAYTRLKNAQVIAGLGYWSRDLTEDVSYWSDETFKIHGFEPGEIKPTFEKVKSLFHPDDRYLIESDSRELPDHGVKDFTHRIITKQGDTRWVHQRITLEKNALGEPMRFEGVIQDITEQKQAREELRLSNERFELAMQATNEMIWDWNVITGKINRGGGYEDSFGYMASEKFSKSNSWFSKVHPGDIDGVWNSLQMTIENPDETFWKKEYRILLTENKVAYVIDRCYILRDDRGNALRAVGATLDVTESRNHIETINAHNSKLREIAWMQSHVVRAPLARLMGLVQLLKSPSNQGPEDTNLHDIILDSAKELDGVIHRITEKIDTINFDSAQ